MLEFFSKNEYQEMATLFSLGQINKINYFKQGYQTPKILASTDKGRFIIAKHNLSKKHTVIADMKIVSGIALEDEINLLNHIKSLPVPHYIKSKNNKYLEDYKRYSISVYKFIKGKQPKKLTPKMLYQLGVFVGAFHKLGSKYKKPMRGRRRFYDLNPRVVKLMYRYAKKQTHPLLKKAVEEIKSGVEKNRLPKNLPKGPIHVDIKPDNELFIGEKLTGIIDFGNTYTDPFIFDVGKTIMWNCVRTNSIDRNLMKKFLAGYETQKKLSKKEKGYLKQSILFAIYSHLWVDLYHVPIKYVPESYTVSLIKKFLPIARQLERRRP